MKLFSGSANKVLAGKIAGELHLSVSAIELHVFPDGEQRVMLKEDVVGEDVILVQPTNMPVDQNILQLLFLINAAKGNGARSVTVIIPYLGYSRQDHIFRSGEARSLEVVIRALEEAGADRFICVDLHSIKIPQLFQKEVTHHSALELFAEKILELGFSKDDTVLVSPDMGGINRIEKISMLLDGMAHAAIEKNRDLESGDVEADVVHGGLKRRALIVDDMISSGGTIKTACDLLISKGVEEIHVFATHAIFSAEAPKILQDSKAERIYITDTVAIPEDKRFEKLEILSVAPMIAAML